MIYKLLKNLVLIYLFLCLSSTFGQRTNLDWKLHNIGEVRQLVTNMGTLWQANVDYPGLIYSEFPRESHEEHIGEGGIWVGAIFGSDTLVSVTTSWNSNFEFYPTDEPWDTIWIVNKNDTVDIPYWQGYVGVSDQDLICRYSDYNIRTIPDHHPLYLDVIQNSYSWASEPLDEMLIFNFKVISTNYDLDNVYVAYWLDGNVGYRGSGWDFALDDYSVYYSDKKFGVSVDDPGHFDGTAYSPIGVQIFPPENIPSDSLRWTFNWYPGQGLGAPPGQDALRYEQMASGVIMENQQDPIGSQFIISFGPVDMYAGDTLSFFVAVLFGEGEEGILKNVDRLDWLVGQDFKVPSPPPLPPLRIKARNHEVILKWDAQPGDINPETYIDPYRADSSQQPFEGYRIYKSTRSAAGPWTLLGEYDLPNDGYGYNTGLEHEYIDKGLLNNFDYYYSVTAYSKEDTVIDFPSQESSIYVNAKQVIPGTAPPQTVGEVAVVPNPYRGDIAYQDYDPQWEKPTGTRDRWMEQDRRIQFINLPISCEIKIFTLAGDLVATILHDNPSKGYEDWNLTSDVGQTVSSGIYLFTIEDTNNGQAQIGKFVIIK
ncbi:MAG: hypothetical protein A2V93_07980 [Ignavibacteria bacterium RBG_16_34_14]|nr:MAG: hypothetical protein A2V93_07980 [Ignavibacteria bacterium RBG_16_34_14]